MKSTTPQTRRAGPTFLLDKTKKRRERFSQLRPEFVSSLADLRNSLPHATKDSLWISYEPSLTEGLLKSLSWPSRALGNAIFMHALKPQTLLPLAGCFHRFAVATNGGFLPPDELAEVLHSAQRADLFIGGSIDRATRTLLLWRGNLASLTLPFAAFAESGDGVSPNFDDFSITDYGQTVRLGDYEAAANALLYEFDPDYRRRIGKHRLEADRSFGASLRRLRKQRGLRQQDFSPLPAKTIARIEQGKVRNVRAGTMQVIAKHLQIAPEEIATY